MIFISVDLPAPLWPSSATRIPGRRSSETCFNASTVWKRLVSCETVKIDVIEFPIGPAPGNLGLMGGSLGRDRDIESLHQRIAVAHTPRQGRGEARLAPTH